MSLAVPRVKQRTPELKERVLQAAVTTLRADGVTGFTTRKVAAGAATSTNAVYELFGDRAGLVREVFFEGFRLLGQDFDRLPSSEDPRTDLLQALVAARSFVRQNPRLADLMFSQPFADFHPGPDDLEAGVHTREYIMDRVRRCLAAGIVSGDATDIAHVLLAVVQGLVAQERAGWLGTSTASIDRRWSLALRATFDGLR